MRVEDINRLGRRNRSRENLEVPSIIEGILRRMAGWLSESDETDDPDRIVGNILGELNDIQGDLQRVNGQVYPSGGSFNLIPSKSNRRGCTELLITFCSKKDSFEKRLRESLDHVTKHCRNTKDIYFFTTKWNSTVFDKFQGYLDMVREGSINVVFIYIGMDGLVVMPE